jgi:hypothetical protein
MINTILIAKLIKIIPSIYKTIYEKVFVGIIS